MQRVQIAQAALSVLDVGLDLVAALARSLMSLIALGHLGVDEAACRALDDFGAKALLEAGVELRVAVDEARIEQGGGDSDVAGAELDAMMVRATRGRDIGALIALHGEKLLG